MDELLNPVLRLLGGVTPIGQWVVIMYFLERIAKRGVELWQGERRRRDSMDRDVR